MMVVFILIALAAVALKNIVWRIPAGNYKTLVSLWFVYYSCRIPVRELVWYSILAKTALWIVPTEAELMMSYSILIGIIHMYAGMFMKALNYAPRSKV